MIMTIDVCLKTSFSYTNESIYQVLRENSESFKREFVTASSMPDTE